MRSSDTIQRYEYRKQSNTVFSWFDTFGYKNVRHHGSEGVTNAMHTVEVPSQPLTRFVTGGAARASDAVLMQRCVTHDLKDYEV